MSVAVWQCPNALASAVADSLRGVGFSFHVDLRPFALVGAISVFMHLLCDALGLKAIMRWLFATLVPCFAMLGWWFWWVAEIKNSGVHHPITVSPFVFLIFDLFTFTIGFAIVSWMLALVRPLLTDTSEQSQPENHGHQ